MKLLLLSIIAQFQWTFLGETETMFAYMDRRHVQSSGPSAWQSVMEVRFKVEQSFSDGQRYDAMRSIVVNDCTTRSFRILSISVLFDGRSIDELPTENSKWMPISEGTPSGVAWHMLCGTSI